MNKMATSPDPASSIAVVEIVTKTSSSSKPNRSRCCLTLQQKIEVIKEADTKTGITIRALAEQFGCGKTQISDILKNRESILSLYGSNASKSACFTSKRSRVSEYSEINEALYQWYLLACSKNVHPSGSQLAEKAKEIAVCLGKPEFKGSNGWLDKWKKRFNVKKAEVSGNSANQGESVDFWNQNLPEILKGYKKEDVYTLDEAACYWQALPEKDFIQKCASGQNSKTRVTVLFLVNAVGDKEEPVVVWKYKNPRCFRGLNKDGLPVKYFSQRKAWMTREILDEVLMTFNRKMTIEKRFVLIFMGQAGCHPEYLDGKYSNIKVVFFPKNTATNLQPLRMGVVQMFKVYYRKLLLRYVLAKTDSCTFASEIAKSINILTAIRWISRAWNEVKPESIIACFRQGGILNTDLSATTAVEENTFDASSITELSSLILKTTATDGCSTDEYIKGDDDFPICVVFDDETWERSFLEGLVPGEEEEPSDPDFDDDFDMLPPPTKLRSYGEAMQSLEDVKNFLESHACFTEASNTSSLVDQVARLHSSTTI